MSHTKSSEASEIVQGLPATNNNFSPDKRPSQKEMSSCNVDFQFSVGYVSFTESTFTNRPSANPIHASGVPPAPSPDTTFAYPDGIIDKQHIRIPQKNGWNWIQDTPQEGKYKKEECSNPYFSPATQLKNDLYRSSITLRTKTVNQSSTNSFSPPDIPSNSDHSLFFASAKPWQPSLHHGLVDGISCPWRESPWENDLDHVFRFFLWCLCCSSMHIHVSFWVVYWSECIGNLFVEAYKEVGWFQHHPPWN